jgi:hypothetical protein
VGAVLQIDCDDRDELKKDYKVVIGQSRGTLPKHLQMTWEDIGCDSLDLEVRKQAKVEAKYVVAMDEAIDNRLAHARHEIQSPKRPTKSTTQGRLPQSDLPQ